MNIFFIAPHHDDIAFSLSGIICSLHKKFNLKLILINLFSISNHIKSNKILSKLNGKDLVPFASKIRKTEDKKFCKKYDIASFDFDFQESALYCNPFEFLKFTKKDIKNNRKAINLIKEINKNYKFSNSIIFAPLGIGCHKDHIATYNFVKRLYENLKKINIVFYEDLPYAYNIEKKKKRLLEVSNFFKYNQFKSINFSLYEKELLNKEKDVKIYKSQLSDEEFNNFKIDKYCNCLNNNSYCETLWAVDSEVLNFLSKTLK